MQSMDEIYQNYAHMVYRYLCSLTRDADLSEELTQETFYQAIRSSHTYDESCAITTWLCGIARNTLRTYQRKHPVQEDIEEQELVTSSAEEDALKDLERRDLFRLIHALEDPYREVVYLRVLGDLSFKEIGEVMARTENWARVTFYRGKEKLKEGKKHV